MNSSLRLYVWVNFYLSSIQQGIQTAHVVHSLFVKYPMETSHFESGSILWEWAKNDKTIITLNGGAMPDIEEAFNLLLSLRVPYQDVVLPIECFYEDASLKGMMTSFGIVVPQCFYDAKLIKNEKEDCDVYVFDEPTWEVESLSDDSPIMKRTVYHPETPEFQLISMLKSCGLAR